MTDELKPVRCGCGGEAQVFFPFTNNSVYMIECKKCGICTSAYETEAEAIEAWNRAMGKRDDVSRIERKKGEWICQGQWMPERKTGKKVTDENAR